MSLKEATLIIAVLDLLANIPLVVQSGVGLAVFIQGWSNHPEEPDSGAFLFRDLGTWVAIMWLIQGGFFNWPSPEFAKCWPVSNWPPIGIENVKVFGISTVSAVALFGISI